MKSKWDETCFAVKLTSWTSNLIKNIRLKPQIGLSNQALKNGFAADLNPWPAAWLIKLKMVGLFTLGRSKYDYLVDLSFQIKGYGEISIILYLLKKICPQIDLDNHLPLVATILAEIISTIWISLSWP